MYSVFLHLFVCKAYIKLDKEDLSRPCIIPFNKHDMFFSTSTTPLTLSAVWAKYCENCWDECSSADTLKKLDEIGGMCLIYVTILLVPYMWLRKRKGCWELKCSMAELSRAKETEVIKDRDTETSPLLQDESWLSTMNLVCFADFTTVRRSFTLEEEGVQIDLDQADFGYQVGEVEVVVPQGGDMQSALERIDRTAQKLGLTGDKRVEGKMHVYLKRNHPEHYAKLLSERIL
ncbi:Thiamine-triphosphatase [Channa argus]|uniref:Thiamine-triphosphatase n=1 Tax=Channa argus TaxID=215402 RepID=A0A6G1QLI4_CHAAH|nr:Thiamine-triphosphatase [Channa argus]